MRVDAERNRERILDAARAVFTEQGLDVSLNEVARRAGVGVATLFRRFPTRDDLLAAVFAEKMTAYVVAIDDAVAHPDPWEGFCGFVEHACQMQADDRAFADVLALTFPLGPSFEAELAHAARSLAQLITKAQASGQLRSDFVHQDVPLILMANAGVVAATRDAAPEASRRLVAMLLQSLSSQNARALPRAPSKRAMFSAVRRASTTLAADASS